MPKYFRLTARAQMHGEVREPGYVFTLADGETGPTKTVPEGSRDAQITDHIGGSGGLVEVPLYVEVSAEQQAAIEQAEAKKIAEADAHAEASQAAPAAPEPEAAVVVEGDPAADVAAAQDDTKQD
jgi:hypothetical protein